MRVAVTGATGFIGKSLCGALADRGDEVVAITRDVARARRVLPPPIEIVAWEAGEGGFPDFDALQADGLVHLAAETVSGRWGERHKKAIYDSRILSTSRLVAQLSGVEAAPGVLIVASAIGYYGDRGEETLDEESRPGDDFLARVCRDWEAEAAKAETLGLRTVRIRTGLALGAGGGLLKTMLTPFRLGLGGPLGNGRQWMSWIHLDDEVGLILHALDRRDVHGPLNATAPHPVRNHEFTRVLARILRRPAVTPLPAFALRVMLGEAAGMALASQRVAPTTALATGYRFRYSWLEPALAACLRPA